MSSNFTKNALVTGAARRLGREIAISLAQQGWNIVVHHNSSPADDVVEEIQKLGVKAVAVKADLLNFAEVRKIMPTANKELGEINLLVNSASLFEKISFLESDENAFDSHMDIHAKVPFFLSQDFVNQCKGEGQIINIVDSFTCRNKSKYFAYLLSKKTLRSLSQMLSAELAPQIVVNSVLPGAVEEFSDNLDQEFLKRRITQLPMQKLATAKQITNAVNYLAANRLTGQEIFIDGGEKLI